MKASLLTNPIGCTLENFGELIACCSAHLLKAALQELAWIVIITAFLMVMSQWWLVSAFSMAHECRHGSLPLASCILGRTKFHEWGAINTDECSHCQDECPEKPFTGHTQDLLLLFKKIEQKCKPDSCHEIKYFNHSPIKPTDALNEPACGLGDSSYNKGNPGKNDFHFSPKSIQWFHSPKKMSVGTAKQSKCPLQRRIADKGFPCCIMLNTWLWTSQFLRN